jgi:hypothetical protein
LIINQFFLTLTTKRLTIANLGASDSGMYQCVLSSDLGSAATSAYLTVAEFGPRFHANLFPARVFVVQGTKLVFLNFFL